MPPPARNVAPSARVSIKLCALLYAASAGPTVEMVLDKLTGMLDVAGQAP